MANMAFPHVTNSTAAANMYEPVVPSNFLGTFVLMGSLKEALGDYTFLSEYIKSISGMFIEKSANTIEAGFQTVKFRYDSNEKETYYEIEVAFHNFLDNDNRMLVYNALAAWSRQKYNPLTGEKTLKSITPMLVWSVKIPARRYDFWRRIAHNMFPMSDLTDQSGDYSAHDMQEITVTFNADYVSDVTNDPRLAGDTF